MLIDLLVFILILGVIVWAIGLIPMDARLRQIAYVIVAIIAIVYALRMLGLVAV
jgi:hypothetical protein